MLYQLSYSRMVPVMGLRPFMAYPHLEAVGKALNEWWGEQDSNLRSCEAADLQSAPVGHLGISPLIGSWSQ